MTPGFLSQCNSIAQSTIEHRLLFSRFLLGHASIAVLGDTSTCAVETGLPCLFLEIQELSFAVVKINEEAAILSLTLDTATIVLRHPFFHREEDLDAITRRKPSRCDRIRGNSAQVGRRATGQRAILAFRTRRFGCRELR